MSAEHHEQFRKICRKIGWKCTAQRLAVFAFIHDNYTHPNVDGVWKTIQKTLPSVTRESIYRILNEFASHGIVHRLDPMDSARYDGQVGPHGHFLCTQCGDIQDFPLSKAISVPKQAGFGEVEHLELRLTGICRRCRKTTTTQQPGERSR